jgi:hypothetical protein
LLIMLPLHPGQLVTASQLIDGLWPQAMPAAAPFGPRRPNTEPVRTARSIPSSATVSSYRLTSPSATIEYVMSPPCRPVLTDRPDLADTANPVLTSR